MRLMIQVILGVTSLGVFAVVYFVLKGILLAKEVDEEHVRIVLRVFQEF
jgi:hypothetical protein